MKLCELNIPANERRFGKSSHRAICPTGKYVSLTVACVIAICVVGCGEKAKLAGVSGHVTLDDELLTSGNVAFHPTDKKGNIAYGQIDANGSYILRVGSGSSKEPTIAAGEYKVTVTSRAKPVEGIAERGGPPDPGTTKIPSVYRSPSTTPLTFTLKEGSQVIDLPLTREAGKNDEPEEPIRPAKPQPEPTKSSEVSDSKIKGSEAKPETELEPTEPKPEEAKPEKDTDSIATDKTSEEVAE